MPHIIAARVNLTDRRVAVEWRDGKVDPAGFIDRLSQLGFRAYPFDSGKSAERRGARWRRRCCAASRVAGFAAMNVMLLSVAVWSGNVSDITPEQRDFFHWLSALIALPAAAYAGRPFFLSAFARVCGPPHQHGCADHASALLLALGMSVVETAQPRGARLFRFGADAALLPAGRARARADDAAADPRRRRQSGGLRAEATARRPATSCCEVPVGVDQPGDRVLVRPGDRFAADGVVAPGASQIDDSLITGETCRSRRRRRMVYAGTHQLGRARCGCASRRRQGTLLDEIERLLETRARGAVALCAARRSRGAALRAGGACSRRWRPCSAGSRPGRPVHDALVTAIAVLIITCPCALALAVPAVQVVATGALFRAGVLLNRRGHRAPGRVDTIVFDKTGTLTLPEPDW